MFTVWRRSDGYINASKRDYPMTAKGLNQTMAKGLTFEVLLYTEDWPTARDRIIEARAESS